MTNSALDGTLDPEGIDPLQAPLDEEERALMDPETWDGESAEDAIVEADAHSITEVRRSYDELVQIERAATANGMTVNAYPRYAALHCALHVQPA